jgi:hypothetical protein
MGKTFKLALIVFSLTLFSFNASGQGAKLLLTDIQIAENAGRYERYADKEANLFSDVPITILLYRENNVSYYASYLFTQRGRKLKLKISDYIVYRDKKIPGETQVFKQKIHDDLEDERMVGVRDEEMVYDEAMDGKIRVVYRIEVLY